MVNIHRSDAMIKGEATPRLLFTISPYSRTKNGGGRGGIRKGISRYELQ
jgi:hypothetical protein